MVVSSCSSFMVMIVSSCGTFMVMVHGKSLPIADLAESGKGVTATENARH